MNEIVGYDIFDKQRFPRFSGPCRGCGATNYGLSTSGPDYCGSCACGRPPEVSRLRRELDELSSRHMDALLALQVATGHKIDGMTTQMRQRGEECLERFKRNGTLRTRTHR